MSHKFNIGQQLNKSLGSETERSKDKFSRADEVLAPKSKENPDNIKNEKTVREGFSLLESELKAFEQLRFQLTSPGFFPTKSALFRAMLSICKTMDNKILIDKIVELESIKQR